MLIIKYYKISKNIKFHFIQKLIYLHVLNVILNKDNMILLIPYSKTNSLLDMVLNIKDVYFIYFWIMFLKIINIHIICLLLENGYKILVIKNYSNTLNLKNLIIGSPDYYLIIAIQINTGLNSDKFKIETTKYGKINILIDPIQNKHLL